MECIFERPGNKLSIKKGKKFSLKPDPGLMKILIMTVIVVLFAGNRALPRQCWDYQQEEESGRFRTLSLNPAKSKAFLFQVRVCIFP